MESLNDFAQHLLRCADEWGVTPVVLWDRELRVRKDFYVALLDSLLEHAQRPMRLECIDPVGGPFSTWRHRKRLRLIKRILTANPERYGVDISVESRVVISRPAGTRRPFVVALADESVSLPIWTRGLRLTLAPQNLSDFQVVPQ